MRKLLIVALVGAAIWWAQSQNSHDSAPARESPDPATLQPEREIAKAFTSNPDSGFACDGRTRCTEMRSCEEAEFFLRNCPNVKMDGDGDGLPCEDQHCSHKR